MCTAHGLRAISRASQVSQWVDSLGPYCLFVTVTARFASPSRSEFEAALRLLINRINRLCYGRQGRRGKRSVASFCVIEKGGSIGRLHAHLLLGRPPQLGVAGVREIVWKTLRKIRLFGYSDVRSYCRDRHAPYVLKEGQDAILVDACRTAK